MAWIRFRLTRSITPTAVLVRYFEAFGNAVNQLSNAIQIADATGIPCVAHPRSPIFRRSWTSVNTIAVSSQLGAWRPWAGEAVLAGWFFWDREFPDICAPERAPEVLHALGSSVIDPERVVVHPRDHLVVHLRGGDVFQDPAPSHYGQPPLAFYQAVWESHPWSGLSIVTQDEANPVLSGLIDYATHRGVTPHLQSGSLLDDIHYLAGARSLVVAAGSFGRAVIVLSRHLERVYSFEDTAHLYPLDPHVESYRGVDVAGTYRAGILSRNWRNTAQQRAMMLTYPSSAIHLDRQ